MNIESDRGKKLKVLAADSHWIARSALAKLLQGLEQELQTLEAANLDDALELAKAHADLDLILIDPVMPGMSGLEGLQAMRKTAAGVPIIVISSRSAEKHREHAFKLGADVYLSKPFDEKVLLHQLAGFTDNVARAQA